MWLSFLATQPGRIEIAALTRAAIAAPADVIASRPRFNPLPTGLTGRAGTLDWGWLYDRNGDGRVDYLLQLQNAHPVLPEPLPADFPTVEVLPDGRVRLTRELACAMIDHAQMVFRHYADDAFAGAVDAVVVEEFDAQWPMFVSGFVAYLAAREGREESAWAFRSAIAERRRDLARDPQRGIMLPTPLPGRPEPAAARLAQGSRLLRLINDALARCPASAGAVAAPEKGSGSISRLPFGK